MLAALTKQVAYGPINKCKKLPEIGYFDWFGNDRQKAWTELGNMKKNHAMEELIHLVDKSIPGQDQEIVTPPVINYNYDSSRGRPILTIPYCTKFFRCKISKLISQKLFLCRKIIFRDSRAKKLLF